MARKSKKSKGSKPKIARSRALPTKPPTGANVVKGSGGYLGSLAGRGLAWLLGKDKKTQDDWASKGSSVDNILHGSGAYDIAKNSFVTGAPFMHSQDPRARICHREFLGNVTGSTLFNIVTYDINPGQASTFPWLSREAVNWEEYKFHGLCFTFRSLSATALNSTNTALGAVCMATQYNSLNPQFTTKIQMQDAQFGVSGKPAQDLVHFVECADTANPLNEGYVRSGPVQGDQRVTDLGKFSFATVGMQASAEIGELWVSYDVEFLKPKLLYEGVSEAAADHWTWNDGVLMDMNRYFGGDGNRQQLSSAIGGTINTSDEYTFPATISSARYFVVILSYHDCAVYRMPHITVTNGAVLWTHLANDTKDQSILFSSPLIAGSATPGAAAPANAAGGVCYALVQAAPGGTIKFVNGGNNTTAGSKGDLIVASYGGPGFGKPDLKLAANMPDCIAEAAVTDTLVAKFGMRMDEYSDFHKFFLDYRQMEGRTPYLEQAVRWLIERRCDRAATVAGRSRLDDITARVAAVADSPAALYDHDRVNYAARTSTLLQSVDECKADDMTEARHEACNQLAELFNELHCELLSNHRAYDQADRVSVVSRPDSAMSFRSLK